MKTLDKVCVSQKKKKKKIQQPQQERHGKPDYTHTHTVPQTHSHHINTFLCRKYDTFHIEIES